MEPPDSSIVGAILYIAVMSRPDIAFHASILAKFLADPSEECCNAATQLLQYLACTRKRKMYFSGQTTIPEGLLQVLQPANNILCW